MKKLLYSVLILIIALFFLSGFSGCKKMSVSNLSANKHLREANKLYTQEKFRKASEEYETALEKNPELDVAYLYLGTCYSMLYKPGKETSRNQEYSEKAVKYLQMAEEAYPDNDDVVIALGGIFDKIGNFEEAEKYFLKILEKSADSPKSYYTLANFYSQNGKFEKANEMYEKRIELEPTNPSGYHYYAVYLQNYRAWDKAIDAHKKRIYTMMDPTILDHYKDIDKIKADIKRVEDLNKYVRNVERNKAIPADQKKTLLAEKREELKNYPTLEEAIDMIAEKEVGLSGVVAEAEKGLVDLSEEKKLEYAEAYYSLGVVAWNKSYQTPVDDDIFPKEERKKAIDTGFAALEKAMKLSPEYPNPYSYMGLLWREMIKIDPANSAEFVKKNNEYNTKFKDIYVKKRKREEYLKELEELEK
ncbi:MAG: tetratricopeptide repeat protein [Acidobacteriota bacterium]